MYMYKSKVLSYLSDSVWQTSSSSETIHKCIMYVKSVPQMALLCHVVTANNLTSDMIFSFYFWVFVGQFILCNIAVSNYC